MHWTQKAIQLAQQRTDTRRRARSHPRANGFRGNRGAWGITRYRMEGNANHAYRSGLEELGIRKTW